MAWAVFPRQRPPSGEYVAGLPPGNVAPANSHRDVLTHSQE